LDTQAPSTLSISPVTGDDLVNSNEIASPVPFEGSAEPGSTVEITITVGGSTVGPITAEASESTGEWIADIDISSLPDGTATVTAIETDPAGNPGSPVTRNFEIDTGLPTIAINTPITADDAINSIEASNTPVSGTSSEANQAVVIEISDGTHTVIQNVVTDASGDWSATFDIESLDDSVTPGVTVTATIVDTAGNANSDSHNFILETTIPVLTIDSNLDGNDIVDASEEGTATISGTGEEGTTVLVTLTDMNSNMISGSANVTSGVWTLDLDMSPTLVDGDIQIDASTSDTYGNPNTASHNIRLDTSTFVTISTPISMDDVINSAEASTLRITGSGEAHSMVQVTISDQSGNSTTLTDTTDSADFWSVVFDVSSFTEERLDIVVVLTDEAGNVDTDTHFITFDGSASDLSIDLPIEDDNVINSSEQGAVVISGVGEPGARVNVTLFDSTGAFVNTSATVSAGGSWSITIDSTSLQDGDILVAVDQTDSEGNTANTS
jgi:hypothetical protein